MNSTIYILLLLTVFAAVATIWSIVDAKRYERHHKKGVHE